jgi:hypothetical protein
MQNQYNGTRRSSRLFLITMIDAYCALFIWYTDIAVDTLITMYFKPSSCFGISNTISKFLGKKHLLGQYMTDSHRGTFFKYSLIVFSYSKTFPLFSGVAFFNTVVYIHHYRVNIMYTCFHQLLEYRSFQNSVAK